MDNMPHSVPGKGKANENKTNKSIQVEGREAAESSTLKQCFTAVPVEATT